jgi:hypothetical protein
MKIHDLAAAKDKLHRTVGSQLVYNRQSRQIDVVKCVDAAAILRDWRL